MVWGVVLIIVNFAMGMYFEKPKRWKAVTRFLSNVFWLPLFIVAMTKIGLRKMKKAKTVKAKKNTQLTVVR